LAKGLCGPDMTTKVLIVGATSAIAEQVARCYAKEGARLYLLARNSDHLDAIADDLRIRGAEKVVSGIFEATAYEQHEKLIENAWSVLGRIDVVLIAHGSLPDQQACQVSFAATHEAFEVNALSAISLLTPLANRMQAAGAGTLAVIGSVAGDRGRQSNYVYGAAKGGLDIYLQGLAHRLTGSGVNVVTIKPGFVDTPMTAQFEKGRLWASPERVARDIYRGIRHGKQCIYTPWFWRYIMLIIRLMPTWMLHRTGL
jgi:decaprenylphospho-beta-D-erythro-pentofuranosid-2-ulose 2-reductase